MLLLRHFLTDSWVSEWSTQLEVVACANLLKQDFISEVDIFKDLHIQSTELSPRKHLIVV
jgi:hypothetical protein